MPVLGALSQKLLQQQGLQWLSVISQQSTAEAVVQAIARKGGRAVNIPCDVTQEHNLETLVQETVQAPWKAHYFGEQCGRRRAQTI